MSHTQIAMKALIQIILSFFLIALLSTQAIYSQKNYLSKDGNNRYLDVSKSPRAESSVFPKFVLHPNFPNPVTGYMTIKYEVKEPGHYIVSIVGSKGQELKRLVDKKHQKGEFKILWAASPKAHGVYMYKMNQGIPSNHRQLLLLKY